MLSRRHFGVFAVLVLSACVGSEPTSPDGLELRPSSTFIDGETGGVPEFSFLPPLDEDPVLSGTFNPDLSPAMWVCTLAGPECVAGDTAAYFPHGSIAVASERYELSWDTDGPETELDRNEYYRLQIVVGGTVMGYRDLDPKGPDEPASSDGPSGFFSFRIGETVPVEFWISTQAFCEVDGVIVLECITNAVIDDDGGELRLEDGGEPLALFVPGGALPGNDPDPILVTLERIDPDQFLATEGVECIPFFDAPQFGPCFRVTTEPPLSTPLEEAALISICVDMDALPQLNLPLEQDHQLQIVRFATDGSNAIEALPGTAGDCPTETASLFDVPEIGFLRYAALGANWLARAVGPEPVAATNIRLGGLTSSFSRFRFALPGQMTPGAGNASLLQAGDPSTIEASVLVLDQAGIPVEEAQVHFATVDGSTDLPEATTDVDGFARVLWTVDTSTPGLKTLTASALGLLVTPVPEHSNGFPFAVESLALTVTVVGAPAAIAATPGEDIAGTAGSGAGELTVVVSDANGNPVAGAAVTWSGDGSVVGGEVTDASGTATGTWTLPTTVGERTITATVGGLSATFTALVSPSAAADLVVAGDGQTGSPGSSLPAPLSVQVMDQYGNPRAGDAVSWSVTSGGGSIAGGGTTDAEGRATATWTLGLVGTQSATVVAGGLGRSFGANLGCAAGRGTAAIDGVMSAGEWACAATLPFTTGFWGKLPGEIQWMNDGENLYMAVRIRRTLLSWLVDVRFDFDNDGDGRAELNDDVIGYEALKQSFIDGHLTSRCLGHRQSECYATDRVKHGRAHARSEGLWTVYELSHPLSSGDSTDLAVAAGSRLGFFMTLAIGHGAVGNVQVPGFRVYQPVTIAGP